jgi:hypothetical protein
MNNFFSCFLLFAIAFASLVIAAPAPQVVAYNSVPTYYRNGFIQNGHYSPPGHYYDPARRW